MLGTLLSLTVSGGALVLSAYAVHFLIERAKADSPTGYATFLGMSARPAVAMMALMAGAITGPGLIGFLALAAGIGALAPPLIKGTKVGNWLEENTPLQLSDVTQVAGDDYLQSLAS